jgi:outer membrane lipoprotein-sorting protein
MADLRDVIGLLYRADWTRLSLTGEVRFEQNGDLIVSRDAVARTESMRRMGIRPGAPGVPAMDEDPDDERRGYHRWQAALLIAPGRRYRLEYEGDHGGHADGSDGEQVWTLRPPDPALLPPRDFGVAAGLPVPALFWPAGLLPGFTLEVSGPVTAVGRDAIAVTARPRHGAVGSITSLGPHACDRIELIVDAETGILLRREETFEGQLLTLAELTTVTMTPPEADDQARFAPPAGSRTSEDSQENQGPSGLGWEVTKNVGSLAAGGLGAWMRLSPHLPGHRPATDDNFMAAMPSPEPAPLDPGDGPPPSGDLLGLLYRSGQYDGDGPQVRDAVMRHWKDAAPVLAMVSDTFPAAGQGGFGYLIDAISQQKTVSLTTGRLRIGGHDRYRVDFSSPPPASWPVTITCDGEQRWQVYKDVTLVGPARPMTGEFASLVGSSWLLCERLSGGAEIMYQGRRGYHLRVTRGDGERPAGPATFYPLDAIVDAETGCLLRLISYDGDTPASWWELDDVSAAPADTTDPAVFRPDLPPGARVVPESGHPLADFAAAWPGLTGTAARTATEAVRRTAGAVSAARSFLDDLRGAPRPPRS